MFGRIAGGYDFFNHFFSLGIDRYWRKELVELIPELASPLVLDVAAGTLDVSLAVLNKFPAAKIPAIDFCLPMLVKGQSKVRRQGASGFIAPIVGDALALPVANSKVDCLTMAFGIRNIRQRAAAFAEMRRVLKPGGKACILEFGSGREKIWWGLYNSYLMLLLPAIGRLASRDRNAYQYLASTIRDFPSAPQLAAEMKDAGFVDVGFRKLTSGIVCLHWGFAPKCDSKAA